MRDDFDGPDPLSQAALRMVPKVGSVMAQYRVDRYEQQKRRAVLLGDSAAELIDPEELFRRIAADERLADMFEAAVSAAISSSSDDKIRLLGRALASGALAEDQARVDESAEVLRIATQLEAVDIRALVALGPGHWQNPHRMLVQEVRFSKAVADVVMARLQTLGLVEIEREARLNDLTDKENDFVDLDETWTVSTVGRSLMVTLEMLG